MTARGTLVAVLLPLALLSACGDDSGSEVGEAAGPVTTSVPSDPSSATPSPTEPTAEATDSPPTTPAWPACSEVWVDEANLPMGYKGCLEGDDAVKADNLSCSSGQRIVRYDDRFYGVAGGMIHEAAGLLDKDDEYLKSIRVCRG